MALVDLMLVASIVAAAFVTSCSIVAQKYFKLYSVFVGKKYAALVHAGLIGTSWLQVFVVGYFVKNSVWGFSGLWLLGIPVTAAAIYLFVKATKEIGLRSLYFSAFFNGSYKKTGKLYARFKHPQYAAICTLFLGIGLTTGRYGYMLAIPFLVATFSLFTVLEKPTKKSSKKQ